MTKSNCSQTQAECLCIHNTSLEKKHENSLTVSNHDSLKMNQYGYHVKGFCKDCAVSTYTFFFTDLCMFIFMSTQHGVLFFNQHDNVNNSLDFHTRIA